MDRDSDEEMDVDYKDGKLYLDGELGRQKDLREAHPLLFSGAQIRISNGGAEASTSEAETLWQTMTT